MPRCQDTFLFIFFPFFFVICFPPSGAGKSLQALRLRNGPTREGSVRLHSPAQPRLPSPPHITSSLHVAIHHCATLVCHHCCRAERMGFVMEAHRSRRKLT